MNKLLLPIIASVLILGTVGLSYEVFAQPDDRCIWNSQNHRILCSIVPQVGNTIDLILPPLILNEPGDDCQITFVIVTHETERTGTIGRALVECDSGAQFYLGNLEYRVSGKI